MCHSGTMIEDVPAAVHGPRGREEHLPWREIIAADVAANMGYPKSILILVGLRAAQFAHSKRGPAGRVAYVAAAAIYKLVSEWVLGVEIPPTTSVGPGLRLRHGVGTVVNPATVIGADVMLRHGVTLGNRRAQSDCPIIEDGADIGAGAVIVGRVRVGHHARIGAGAVVLDNVPALGTAVGAKATILPPSSVKG